MELFELLGIRPGVTALIGGGGKTTAMYTLARELSERGAVICTTTTHIRPPEHMPVLIGAMEAEISAALAKKGCVCVGATTAEGGKLTAPELPVARLASLADYVLVEADGSKGLPVKAHLPHEPVIPAEAAQTILLVGASGFGRPIGEVVHRSGQFCRLTGESPDRPVTEENLARLLVKENLGNKVFVNQTEMGLEQAEKLAALLPWPVFAGALQGGIWKCLS